MVLRVQGPQTFWEGRLPCTRTAGGILPLLLAAGARGPPRAGPPAFLRGAVGGLPERRRLGLPAAPRLPRPA
eukprot:10922830-Lingulodinium_polyedra.AAC.1